MEFKKMEAKNDYAYVLVTKDDEKLSEFDKSTTKAAKCIKKFRVMVVHGARFAALAGRAVSHAGDVAVLNATAACTIAEAAATVLPKNIGIPLAASSALLATIAAYMKTQNAGLSSTTVEALSQLLEALDVEPGLQWDVIYEPPEDADDQDAGDQRDGTAKSRLKNVGDEGSNRSRYRVSIKAKAGGQFDAGITQNPVGKIDLDDFSGGTGMPSGQKPVGDIDMDYSAGTGKNSGQKLVAVPTIKLDEFEKRMKSWWFSSAVEFIAGLGFSQNLSILVVAHLNLLPTATVSDLYPHHVDLFQLLWD